MQPVVITGMGSISPLGLESGEIWNCYGDSRTLIRPFQLQDRQAPAAALTEAGTAMVARLRSETSLYQPLDKTVLMAMYAARQAVQTARQPPLENAGIAIGSSRGATGLFERYYQAYLDDPGRCVPPRTSPTTTLGNLASWVARDLGAGGPAVGHSITCSTALHGILNAVAWLNAGMADVYIAGGTEAPLTGFTFAQMRALGIYAEVCDDEYPCRPLAQQAERNTMVMGEGAAVFCLERLTSPVPETALARIDGIGYATELIAHPTSISEDGECLFQSMRKALDGQCDPGQVDAVLLHTPGTIKGDRAELNAVRRLFGDQLPALFSNKWKIGHTLGASGALSLELAILMLRHRTILQFPYPAAVENKPRDVRRVLVNAVGFGGNAVTLLISRAV